jgi:hypothetical protein
MQASYCDLPFVAWGTVSRKSRMPGTWHFYVDDYRYEALWKNPNRLLETGCINIVEPNFSVYQQTPPAVSNFQIYRKRWLARYWQSRGIRVFVDLNVSKRFYEDNLTGVPDGWSAFVTRGYQDRIYALKDEYGLARAISGKQEPLFIVYGGGKDAQIYCQDHNLIWIPDQEEVSKQAKKVKLLGNYIQ